MAFKGEKGERQEQNPEGDMTYRAGACDVRKIFENAELKRPRLGKKKLLNLSEKVTATNGVGA